MRIQQVHIKPEIDTTLRPPLSVARWARDGGTRHAPVRACVLRFGVGAAAGRGSGGHCRSAVRAGSSMSGGDWGGGRWGRGVTGHLTVWLSRGVGSARRGGTGPQRL